MEPDHRCKILESMSCNTWPDSVIYRGKVADNYPSLLKDDVFSKGKDLAPELISHFQIPDYILTNVFRRSNGFFDSKILRKENVNTDISFRFHAKPLHKPSLAKSTTILSRNI